MNEENPESLRLARSVHHKNFISLWSFREIFFYFAVALTFKHIGYIYSYFFTLQIYIYSLFYAIQKHIYSEKIPQIEFLLLYLEIWNFITNFAIQQITKSINESYN